MEADRIKILLTGTPGCGKTTVIRRLLERLERPAAGFFTAEIRQEGRGGRGEQGGRGGRRVGFAVESLDGRRAVMSHVEIGGGRRVGRYGVDVEAFEAVVLPALEPPDAATLVVVDEVGKMECFSDPFVERVRLLLAGPNPVLGTVPRAGGGFPAEVRRHGDVRLIEVTHANRESLPRELLDILEVRL